MLRPSGGHTKVRRLFARLSTYRAAVGALPPPTKQTQRANAPTGRRKKAPGRGLLNALFASPGRNGLSLGPFIFPVVIPSRREGASQEIASPPSKRIERDRNAQFGSWWA
jgi:hypothetical protein